MPNDYFQFKQFLVRQDRCAMKVCTDSCLLGAYAAVSQAHTLLDIGAGTGLLSLMAAQRSAAAITAVEVDARAAAQARENMAASPWAQRLQVVNQSLQDFEKENEQLFEVILCNPPFYKASHKSADEARNVAMHSHELSFEEILRFCHRFLHPAGTLYLLLPPAESRQFARLAAGHQLYVHEILGVYTKTGGRHIRSILAFGHQPAGTVLESHLEIRQADNSYSDAFRHLLRDYYLIF